MKKLFISIIAICVGMCAVAQNYLYVNKTDGTVDSYPIVFVDSVSLAEPAFGEFIVGYYSDTHKSKTVKFAPGNLQYTQSTNTWSFAPNQYDALGTDNVTGGTVTKCGYYCESVEGTALADKIDLFGWSTDNATAPYGINTSTDEEDDYLGNFVDWGKNIGDGETWRMPTEAEWEFLMYSRPNADNKRFKTSIMLNENDSVNGLLILPDSWITPAGISLENLRFTLAQWQQLELAGAVFLPTTGYRYGTKVRRYLYWSDDYWHGETSSPSLGCAVRLVRDSK